MGKFLSLLFVPQEENNHRAGLLQPIVLLVLMSFCLLNQSLIKTVAVVKPGVLGYSSEITSQKVFLMTNVERKKAGLEPLHYNSKLSASAQKKAQDMFANSYWAHNSPSGKTPWDFLKEAEYDYSYAGENLAKDFYDTDSVIKAWMKSPTHKENMVNEKYMEIGVGVVNGILGGIKTTLVVQHFGTPLNHQFSNTTPDEISFNDQQFGAGGDGNVLSQKQPTISPMLINKVLVFFMVGIISIALFIDSYVTLKKGVHRLTGSSAGHITFLLIMLLFIIFTQQGVIF